MTEFNLRVACLYDWLLIQHGHDPDDPVPSSGKPGNSTGIQPTRKMGLHQLNKELQQQEWFQKQQQEKEK